MKKLREKISDLKVILFLIDNKHITTIANEEKMPEKCHIDNKIQQLLTKKMPEKCSHVKYFRSLSKLPRPHKVTPHNLT